MACSFSLYGTGYYDPRTSVWQSPDPILNQYMDGKPNHGVFTPQNLGLYTYTANNPVNLVDPDGEFFWFAFMAVGAAISAYDTYNTYDEAGGGVKGLKAAGTTLAVDGAITVATGGVGKVASKFIPDSVKNKAVNSVKNAVEGVTNKVKQAFGKADNLTPKQGEKVYRVYGDDAKSDGASWSPVNPKDVTDFREKAGLPSGGDSGANNLGRFVIEGILEDPSKVVLTSDALSLDGNKGGLPEYIIPNPFDSGAIKVESVKGVNPEF